MTTIFKCIFQADLPLVDGDYNWADGKSVSVYVSTVVAVHTDRADVIGYVLISFCSNCSMSFDLYEQNIWIT